MGTTIVYRGCIGKMENTMGTTIVYRGDIGIMENTMDCITMYSLKSLKS